MVLRVSLILGVAALQGCVGNCDTRVVGGSDAERAAAEDELREFTGLMTDEVCVPRIRLGGMRKEKLGRYTPSTKRIKIRDDRPHDDIRSSVRHELCHAIQFQHELDLSSSVYQLAVPVDVPADEQAGEAWAYTCQQGPAIAYLMGDACTEDTFGTSIFEDVRSWFHPPDSSLTRPVAFSEVGRIRVEDDVEAEPMLGGRMGLEGADGVVEAVDLLTGAPVSPGPPAADAELEDQRLLVFGAMGANASLGRRLLFDDAQGVTRASCFRDGERPFAHDGQLWTVFRDGEELVWGTWSVD